MRQDTYVSDVLLPEVSQLNCLRFILWIRCKTWHIESSNHLLEIVKEVDARRRRKDTMPLHKFQLIPYVSDMISKQSLVYLLTYRFALKLYE